MLKTPDFLAISFYKLLLNEKTAINADIKVNISLYRIIT